MNDDDEADYDDNDKVDNDDDDDDDDDDEADNDGQEDFYDEISIVAPCEMSILAPCEMSILAPCKLPFVAPCEISIVAPCEMSILAPCKLPFVAPCEMSIVAPCEMSIVAPFEMSIVAPCEMSIVAPFEMSIVAPCEISIVAPCEISIVARIELSIVAPCEMSIVAPCEMSIVAPCVSMSWIIVTRSTAAGLADYEMLYAVAVVLSLLTAVAGYNGAIPIGVIFDKRDTVAQRAFERALAHHKSQSKYRDPHFQLNVTVDVIDVTDNFQLASAICRQMTQGVFAILGQKSYHSADIVNALTSTFQMPFITPSLSQSSVQGGSSSFEVHLRPDHTAAVMDVIEHLDWRDIHFLYDSDEGLHRLQYIFKVLGNDSVHWFSMIKFTNINDVHDDLRMADLSDSNNSVAKSFVLDLSSDEAYQTVLKQIPEVGMNKFGYNYLLTTLDFQSMNLSRFRHGGVNITGFQLLEHPQMLSDDLRRKSRDGDMPNSYGLPVHAALAVDGLKVIEEAISGMLENDSDVFRWIFRRGDLYNQNKTKGIPCTTRPPIPWMFGQNILKLIKKRQPMGLSGSLTFNEDGHRKDFSLGVFSMALDKGIQKIDIAAADIAITDIGASDISITDIGTTDIGTADIGITDIGTADIGITDIGTADISITDIGMPDIAAADIGITDIGIPNIGISDNGAADISIIDIGTSNIVTRSIGTKNLSTVELGAYRC
ncbi:hypothetical protein Btru_032031 [Bulinus truncatus]|nr:hypothetical protein Btru_032031 [Bulinus truncatus]